MKEEERKVVGEKKKEQQKQNNFDLDDNKHQEKKPHTLKIKSFLVVCL